MRGLATIYAAPAGCAKLCTFCQRSEPLAKGACPAEEVALTDVAEAGETSHPVRCRRRCAFARQVHAPHSPHIPASQSTNFSNAPWSLVNQHPPHQVARAIICLQVLFRIWCSDLPESRQAIGASAAEGGFYPAKVGV